MEFLKYSEAPKATKSMYVAIADLSLDHLWVVYPGKDIYPLTEKIKVLPLQELSEGTETFFATDKYGKN